MEKKIMNKTKILFSVSIFKMKESYRPFVRYLYQLFRNTIYFLKTFPNADIRIYHDKSIFDCKDDDYVIIGDSKLNCSQIFKNLKELDTKSRIQFVEYDYPAFKIDKIYHHGTFGTMMRYLPFFETKKETPYDLIIVGDVDLHTWWFNPDIINRFIKDESKMLFGSSLTYNRYKEPNIVRCGKYENVLIGGYIFSKIRFPINIFNNFLDKIINGDFDKIIQSINDSLKSDKKPDPLFPYGLDEYFLNFIFRKELKKLYPNQKTMMAYQLDLNNLYSSIIQKFSVSESDDKNIKKLIKLVETYKDLYYFIWKTPTEKNIKEFINLSEKINKIITSSFDLSNLNKKVLDNYHKMINKRYREDIFMTLGTIKNKDLLQKY
jgi:hypothetical protein